MASSKEDSLKETLRQQGQPLGAAVGSAGLLSPPPLTQGPEDLQPQRHMWRCAMLNIQTALKCLLSCWSCCNMALLMKREWE